MCHLFLAGYEDVPSFLNQLKLKLQPDIVLCRQITGTQAPSILASQSMYRSFGGVVVRPLAFHLEGSGFDPQ